MPVDDLSRERVLVPIDGSSAASPSQLAAAARGAQIAFGVPGPEGGAEGYRELLAAYGDVVDTTDRAAVEAWGPSGVVTFSEAELVSTARLAAALDLPSSSVAALERCTDKAAQRQCWHDAGIDTTRFATAEDVGGLAEAVRQVGIPCVVKPRQGSGSRDVHRLDTDRAVPAVLGGLTETPRGGWIVEELLRGEGPPGQADYVSVEVVADGTTARALAVTGKLPMQEPFREQGGVLPGVVPEDESVCELACRAVEASGLTVGLAHVEIKLTLPRPSLVEVNARMGGYQENLVRSAGGRSLVAVALDAAVGRPVPTGRLHFPRTGWWFAPSPPPDAVRVDRVDGVREIGRWPDVDRALLRATPGMVHDWRVGWGQYVALFEGSGPSLPAALGTVERIRQRLVVEYTTAVAART